MKTTILLASFLMSFSIYAQDDRSEFEKLELSMKSFKLDTTSVPDDKLTAEIRELRKVRGAFNVNNIIELKIAEQRAKKEMPEADMARVEKFFKNGNGKKWLDNAVIWIYRNQYTYEEIIQIKEFYKTPAGQKMAHSFPIIIFQTLKAAELITESLKNSTKK